MKGVKRHLGLVLRRHENWPTHLGEIAEPVGIEQHRHQSGSALIPADTAAGLDVLGGGLGLAEHQHQSQAGDIQTHRVLVGGQGHINAAYERMPALESQSVGDLLFQAKSEIPPEILALQKKAGELYERGEPQQALALMQQVMSWVNTNLPKNDPYRAINQGNMGLLLRAVGRYQEALAPTEEAVKILRGLAKPNLAFLGDLAGSLNNLGNRYIELGRWQEALAFTDQAMKIYREQAKTNPAYLGDLAMALNNLGLCQKELGHPEQARGALEEALAILRPLAASNSAFQEQLQVTLKNLEKLNRK